MVFTSVVGFAAVAALGLALFVSGVVGGLVLRSLPPLTPFVTGGVPASVLAGVAGAVVLVVAAGTLGPVVPGLTASAASTGAASTVVANSAIANFRNMEVSSFLMVRSIEERREFDDRPDADP